MTVVTTCALDQAPSHRVVTDTYEYDAFGNQISHTGTMPNVYMYRGEAYDSDLGLYYLRARWMNPLSGRFMSRDPNNPNIIGPDKIPIDPRMLHKYLYGGGDPVDLVDPRGTASILETGSLDLTIARTTPEIKAFGAAVACSFGAHAYVIALLNGANPMDAFLGGGAALLGCAFI